MSVGGTLEASGVHQNIGLTVGRTRSALCWRLAGIVNGIPLLLGEQVRIPL